jgi:hypothetical protein
MRALTYENAMCAHGPAVVAWLEHEGADLELLDDADRRCIQRWRKGAQASFWLVDRVLVRLGFHPGALPDSAWRAYDNGRTGLSAAESQVAA